MDLRREIDGRVWKEERSVVDPCRQPALVGQGLAVGVHHAAAGRGHVERGRRAAREREAELVVALADPGRVAPGRVARADGELGARGGRR